MKQHDPLHTLAALATHCTTNAIPAWLVGGTIRDLLMGRVPHDLDIAVATDGVALARSIADELGGAFVPLDIERGTGRVVLLDDPIIIIDLVQLRAPTLHDDLVLRDFTINAIAMPLEDAGTAVVNGDLTPTAIAPTLIDPCRGMDDIAARVLRPCSPRSLRDDPLRTLRAVRLAASLAYTITPALEEMLRGAAQLLAQVKAERIRMEFFKLLAMPHVAPWLSYLDSLGILTQLFPELEPARTCDQPIFHFLPVLGHLLEAVNSVEWLLAGFAQDPSDTLSVSLPPGASSQAMLPVAVQTCPELPRAFAHADFLAMHFDERQFSGTSRAGLFKLATLLHDNAKPQTRKDKPEGGVSFYGHQNVGAEIAQTIGQRLRLSRRETAYVKQVVRHHMRLGQLRTDEVITPRAVQRFFRATEDTAPDLLLHDLADHLAARGPAIQREEWEAHLQWTNSMLDALWSKPTTPQAPLVNGHDLITTLGIAPGPLVGTLLREIREAQAAGELASREEALALAEQLVKEEQG